MLQKKYDRRQFMYRAGVCGLFGVATASGLTILGGCDAKEEAEKAAAQPHQAIQAARAIANPCEDLSALSSAAIATREEFDYESRSADGTELCRTCSYWRPSPRGDFCGTCTLMKGPIHPLGTCTSWEETEET